MAESNQNPTTTTDAREAQADVDAGRPLNAVTEHTGQFDVRFLLWRTFCSETNTPVDTLPSELQGELKDRWDKMKDSQLHTPTEQTPTPPTGNSGA